MLSGGYLGRVTLFAVILTTSQRFTGGSLSHWLEEMDIYHFSIRWKAPLDTMDRIPATSSCACRSGRTVEFQVIFRFTRIYEDL